MEMGHNKEFDVKFINNAQFQAQDEFTEIRLF